MWVAPSSRAVSRRLSCRSTAITVVQADDGGQAREQAPATEQASVEQNAGETGGDDPDNAAAAEEAARRAGTTTAENAEPEPGSQAQGAEAHIPSEVLSSDEVLARVSAVTPDDVREVARDVLERPLSLAVIGPYGKADLEKAISR